RGAVPASGACSPTPRSSRCPRSLVAPQWEWFGDTGHSSNQLVGRDIADGGHQHGPSPAHDGDTIRDLEYVRKRVRDEDHSELLVPAHLIHQPEDVCGLM